jgi:hypothetical protein
VPQTGATILVGSEEVHVLRKSGAELTVRRGAPAILRELVVAAQLYAGLAGMQVAALVP